MRLINLTPHAITLIGGGVDGDETYTVPPLGGVLRLDMPHQETEDTIHGIPVVTRGRPSETSVERLNATLRRHIRTPDSPVRVLVPILVLPHVDVSLRSFVFAPDTGPGSVVRDENGRITGVRRLIRES